MLGKAVSIMSEAFANRRDKNNQFFFHHCIAVLYGTREKTDDEDVLCAAVLHDLIEDCPDWSFVRLKNEGFSQRTIDLLMLLTHDKQNQPYMDYIAGVSTDPDAVHIKMADLEHNTDLNRIVGVEDKHFLNTLKYNISFHFLKLIQQSTSRLDIDHYISEMKDKYEAVEAALTGQRDQHSSVTDDYNSVEMLRLSTIR